MNHHLCTWTAEQTEFLKNNYQRMTNIELSNAIGRSNSAIRGKLKALSLSRYNEAYMPWTNKDTELLYANRLLPLSQLEYVLYGRTTKQIKNHLKKLKASRPDNWDDLPPQKTETDWKNYKPSALSFEIPDELIMAVKIQRLLMGVRT